MPFAPLRFVDDADEEPDWLRDWGSAKAQEAQASSVSRLEEAQARLQDRLQRAVLLYNSLYPVPKITPLKALMLHCSYTSGVESGQPLETLSECALSFSVARLSRSGLSYSHCTNVLLRGVQSFLFLHSARATTAQ